MFELTLVMGKLNISMTFGASSVSEVVAADSQGMHQVALLAMQIQQVYTLSELRQLSYFLGVEFENLSGDTLFSKAYGIVSYFQRRCAIGYLISYLEDDQPHVDWRSFVEILA